MHRVVEQRRAMRLAEATRIFADLADLRGWPLRARLQRHEGRWADLTRIFADHADLRGLPPRAEQTPTCTPYLSGDVRREATVFVRDVIRVDPRRFARSVFNTVNALSNAFELRAGGDIARDVSRG